MVMSGRSFNLTTLFLDRAANQYSVSYCRQYLITALLESVKERRDGEGGGGLTVELIGEV